MLNPRKQEDRLWLQVPGDNRIASDNQLQQRRSRWICIAGRCFSLAQAAGDVFDDAIRNSGLFQRVGETVAQRMDRPLPKAVRKALFSDWNEVLVEAVSRVVLLQERREQLREEELSRRATTDAFLRSESLRLNESRAFPAAAKPTGIRARQ